MNNNSQNIVSSAFSGSNIDSEIAKMTTPKQKIKACAYLRMSTDDQTTSIPIQRSRILELAAKERYDIIEWYIDEGLSGSRNPHKRVNWLKLLADSRSCEWEVVLCYNRARWSRLDAYDDAIAIQVLRESGKRLHTVMEGLKDWDSMTGRLGDMINAESAHQYINTLSANTLEGKLKAFRDGRYCPECPYGMSRKITDTRGEVRIISRTEKFTKPKDWHQIFTQGDEKEVATVRWLFATYAAKDIGFGGLARQLNAKNIPAPGGGQWGSKAIRDILMNPTYVGDTRYGRTGIGQFHRLDGDKVVKATRWQRHETREGMIMRDTHEGIIDRELWGVVQEKQKRRTMRIKTRSRGEGGYALTGVLHCGHCGARMYGRRNHHSEESVPVISYVCSRNVRFGQISGCAGWAIRQSDILPIIIGRLTEIIDQRLLTFYANQVPDLEQPNLKDQVKAMKAQRDELAGQIARGAKRMLACRDELVPAIEAELYELKVQLDLLDAQISRAEQPVPQLSDQLRQAQEWFEAAKKEVIFVQPSPTNGVLFAEGSRFTSDSFRETLLRYGCRVTCWWRQRAQKRWEMDRVRIQLGASQIESHAIDPNPQYATPVNLDVPNWGFSIDVEFRGHELFPPSRAAVLTQIMLKMKTNGSTYQQIADHLNGQQLKSSTGRQWNRNMVQRFFTRRLKGEVVDAGSLLVTELPTHATSIRSDASYAELYTSA